MRIRPRRQRFRLRGGAGKQKSGILRKIQKRKNHKKPRNFDEKLKNEKITKTWKETMKIIKNLDYGGATQKRMSPSNSTRKTAPIDLFSSPYDSKQTKTCF